MSSEAQRADVIRTGALSPCVRELVLRPMRRISFAPGQWVSLRLRIGERPPLVRAYTMTEPEQDSGELVLVYDLVPNGKGSGYLNRLQPGDHVTLTGPFGRFVAPEPLTRELVLLARYTGIVPMRCILLQLFSGARDASHLPVPPPVTLIYGGPSREELIYHEEFRQWAATRPGFSYVSTLVPSGTGAGSDAPIPELELLAKRMDKRKDYYPMVSGVQGFVRPVRAYLTELGYDRRHMRCETYD